MADYHKLTGSVNRHTDWTSEVILEADDQGNPTKVVRIGEPVDLSKEERERLEALGYTVESSSKSEADEYASGIAPGGPATGGDVTGAAPVFGDSEVANQKQDTAAQAETDQTDSKSTKNK